MDRRIFLSYMSGVFGAAATGCRTLAKDNQSGAQLASASAYGGPTLPDAFFAPVVMAPSNPNAPTSLPAGVSKQVLIVGGGLAGLSAALELSQRGYSVTVKEAGPGFGGRLRTRTENLRTGTFQVEHGLHMWFHQYYNFFDILTRLGTLNNDFAPYNQVYYEFATYKPELISSVGPYPINLVNIILSSKNLNLLDAIETFGAVQDIIFYNQATNWQRFDNISFVDWSQQTHVNKAFWDIIMEPASSVTLNDPSQISAAEMLLYMHYYFIGNPKAFLRMVPNVDHGTAVINPWVACLQQNNVAMLLNSPVAGLQFQNGKAVGEVGSTTVYDYVILATDVPGTKSILAASQASDDQSSTALASLNQKVSPMTIAPRYHVLRIWFDTPAAPRPFNQAVIETPQYRPINLIANYGMLEQASAAWVQSSGGSIFEFHLYNTPQFAGMGADAIWQAIKSQAILVLPELAQGKPLDYALGSMENFPAFGVGTGLNRPTPAAARQAGIANLGLAGDWIALPYPNALMERAVSTGREAANAILLDDGVRQAEVSAAKSTGPGLVPQF